MKLTIYRFDGAAVRIVMDPQGEPWFVAADLCRVLSISNPTAALQRLDEDERTLVSIEGASNGQPVNAVSESGLYSLILGSRKPEAKRFKKWVTSEVLPAIRKTGSYGPAANDAVANLADPTVLRGLLLGYTEKVLALESTVAAQAPKVAALDQIATATDGSRCITDAAKVLEIAPKQLFAWLHAHQWIFRRTPGDAWQAYQARIVTGVLEHKVKTIERGDGSEKVVWQVLVTPKGLVRLAELQQQDSAA